jgi:hypothetical protein
MPGLLTSDELTAMRDTMDDAFDQSCVRSRIAAGSTTSVGDQADGSTSTATYACRVRHDLSQGVQESVQGSAPVSMGDWRILLPHDADVAPKDTIAIGSDVWQVQEVDDPKSDRLCVVAICTKLDPNPARSS